MGIPTKNLEIRSDLVARIRAEIQSGQYDTPDKLAEAIERLFDRLESD